MSALTRRRGGTTFLRPPAIVGPITILPKPVQPRLAVQTDRQSLPPQRRTRSVLRPPAYVLPVAGPPPGPAGREIEVMLAPGRRRRGGWRFRPPLVVDAPIVTSPPVVTTIQTTLVTSRVATDVRHKVAYFLTPPQAIQASANAPTADQTTLRRGPNVRIRPPAVHWAWVNPAVINPASLDLLNQVAHKQKLVAVQTRRNLPRAFYTRRPTTYFPLVGVQPAAINFTSSVSGTVLRIPVSVAGSINFSSAVSAALAGGLMSVSASFPVILLHMLSDD